MINFLKRSKALISFCMSPTVLCDVLSDFTDGGVVIPMFEQKEDAIV